MNCKIEFEGERGLLPSPVIISLISFPRKKKYPTCPMCSLVFSKESDLKKHLNEDQWHLYQESKYKDYLKCEECCLFFTSTKGFMQHHGKVHVTKYKYSKCPVCEKKFRNKYAVKFHIKQVHEKSTREKCPKCGKDFYNKYLIPQHLEKCKRLSPEEIELI
ncbi:hypothetical protein SteCoe_24517 [Stentor coeruleus]|uniref:C2H2-type domain-containing protein n=1 Tax=Stentor coeruleus TaxID=5963 RepID=A0A1R2BHE8_9CILI|nr:hypothetical protein SteCoe_24517 [Stentor coeruleus]